jgi:hypothetical protein
MLHEATPKIALGRRARADAGSIDGGNCAGLVWKPVATHYEVEIEVVHLPRATMSLNHV